MIHAYFTNGMFENAKVFLQSLFKTNIDRWPVLLDSRDLTNCQVEELHKYYPILEVQNKKLNMDALAKRAAVPVEILWKYRRQAEKQHVTAANKVWKLMIAAEDRPRALLRLIKRMKHGYVVMHFDIDTLFRKSILDLYLKGAQYDCGLLLRPNISPVKARITISTMVWQKTKITMQFFRRWMYWLDFCPPPRRPIGYGQTSCWYAYEELYKELRTYTLPVEWGYPGKNKESNILWSGAVHKLKKADCATQFREEMSRL